jgi:hypothetical protein
MRPFRVFNGVAGVRTIWKFAGLRLGPLGQIAVLALMVLLLTNPYIAAGLFATGFAAVAFYAAVLSRLDDTETLSELTQFVLLRRGLKHRRGANFDLPGI